LIVIGAVLEKTASGDKIGAPLCAAVRVCASGRLDNKAKITKPTAQGRKKARNWGKVFDGIMGILAKANFFGLLTSGKVW
jgi:hypothetical protein